MGVVVMGKRGEGRYKWKSVDLQRRAMISRGVFLEKRATVAF